MGRSRDEKLQDQGWTRRFVTSEPRLSEAVDLYRELGFEVHLEPLPDDPDPESCPEECRICFQGDRQRYRIIYTRRSEGEGSHGKGR